MPHISVIRHYCRNISPNIYKEARKTTGPYCHTSPILHVVIRYRSLVLRPVWAVPHGPPYCFRLCFTGQRDPDVGSLLSRPYFLCFYNHTFFLEDESSCRLRRDERRRCYGNVRRYGDAMVTAVITATSIVTPAHYEKQI